MAFAYKNYDSIKYVNFGTSLINVVLAERLNETRKSKEVINAGGWLNLGNYSTSGTSSTSGTGGTTIIAGGNYTWIG